MQGTVNVGGLAIFVALYFVMSLKGLRLPFCLPVLDVLDFLRLALA